MTDQLNVTPASRSDAEIESMGAITDAGVAAMRKAWPWFDRHCDGWANDEITAEPFEAAYRAMRAQDVASRADREPELLATLKRIAEALERAHPQAPVSNGA